MKAKTQRNTVALETDILESIFMQSMRRHARFSGPPIHFPTSCPSLLPRQWCHRFAWGAPILYSTAHAFISLYPIVTRISDDTVTTASCQYYFSSCCLNVEIYSLLVTGKTSSGHSSHIFCKAAVLSPILSVSFRLFCFCSFVCLFCAAAHVGVDGTCLEKKGHNYWRNESDRQCDKATAYNTPTRGENKRDGRKAMPEGSFEGIWH